MEGVICFGWEAKGKERGKELKRYGMEWITERVALKESVNPSVPLILHLKLIGFVKLAVLKVLANSDEPMPAGLSAYLIYNERPYRF